MTPNKQLGNPVDVLDDISGALRALPGVQALYAFGSLADGRGDAWSDVDLKVLSEDLPLSLAWRHAVLNRVRPIELEWTIEHTDTSWAATVLFDGISLFHKLDIGIAAAGSHGKAAPPGFLRLWDADGQTAELPFDLAPSVPPYTPERGSVQHFVLGQLLGVTRYLKARRRGHVFTCWRFASALIDAMLALRYMRAIPGERLARKLATGEYLELDRMVDAADHDRFFGVLDLSGPDAMDAAVRRVALELITLSAELTRGEPIPPAVVELFTDFFDAELRRGDGEAGLDGMDR